MLQRLINLTPNNVLLIKGPASVKCEGSAVVLGKNAAGEIAIRVGKILPFEASTPSKIKVRILAGGNYRLVYGDSVGVSIWKDVVARISERPKRVMLVGATDTGKSTLTAYLSNVAYANNLKVSVIDGDVGQGDLAPPSCIGGAAIKKQFLDLRDIDAEYYAFIGFISPRGIEELVIDRMKEILHKLDAKSDMSLINTDGYVDEHGIDYKVALAKALKPDLIVCIGNYAEKFAGFEIINVNAPKRITKTRVEREERRLTQYVRFIGKGERVVKIAHANFVFLNTTYDHSIFKGNLVKIGNTILTVDSMGGMFIGLGIRDTVMGFGTIRRITEGKMEINTQYEGKVDTIMLSSIKLSHNMGSEYRLPLSMDRGKGSEGLALS